MPRWRAHLSSMAAGCATGVVVGVEVALGLWNPPAANGRSHPGSETSTAASLPTTAAAPVLRHGVPRSEHIQIVNDRLVTSFDTSTRNPRWVMERISAESVRGSASRQDVQFFEDKMMDERFRNRLEDFRGSGCDAAPKELQCLLLRPTCVYTDVGMTGGTLRQRRTTRSPRTLCATRSRCRTSPRKLGRVLIGTTGTPAVRLCSSHRHPRTIVAPRGALFRVGASRRLQGSFRVVRARLSGELQRGSRLLAATMAASAFGSGDGMANMSGPRFLF